MSRDAPGAGREQIVVAPNGGPEGDTTAVHVARGAGMADGSPEALARQRALVGGLARVRRGQRRQPAGRGHRSEERT